MPFSSLLFIFILPQLPVSGSALGLHVDPAATAAEVVSASFAAFVGHALSPPNLIAPDFAVVKFYVDPRRIYALHYVEYLDNFARDRMLPLTDFAFRFVRVECSAMIAFVMLDFLHAFSLAFSRSRITSPP